MRSLGRLSRLAAPARSAPLLPLRRMVRAPRRWTSSSAAAAAAASASSLALFEAAYAPHAQAPSWPREVLLLCGAPGAGKGSMTALIKAERDLHEVIEMSSLLTSPEMEARKASGALIGDAEVTAALLRALSSPRYAGGVIVDGFPRTAAQAEVCSLLAERLAARARAAGAPPPRFSSLVIYVTEEESVRRQLNRGHELQHYNAMVADVGVGEPLPVRPTDVSEEAARRRWRIFRNEVYAAVQTIKHRFPFHYIDATCSKEEMVRRIKAELAYRPEEELNAETFALMRGIQTAAAVTKSARSALVSRINAYQKENPASFQVALQIISLNFMHIIQRQGLMGRAIIRSSEPALENPLVVNIVLDVLAEHGFLVSLDVVRREVPTHALPEGEGGGLKILHRTERAFVFDISWHVEAPLRAKAAAAAGAATPAR